MEIKHAPELELVEDQPLEFLVNNCELRSFFQYFVKRPDCAGIRWSVAAGTVVAARQVIGELVFITGNSVAIVAPVDGTVVRTYDPNVADLPHRPSQPIALFRPGGGS
ncbi:MAG TPA: hypothetical protein VFD36_14430 [Kofleriaceae bacterium]|nr:hypothetical protein [Kofleriaceae bacterium]